MSYFGNYINGMINIKVIFYIGYITLEISYN